MLSSRQQWQITPLKVHCVTRSPLPVFNPGNFCSQIIMQITIGKIFLSNHPTYTFVRKQTQFFPRVCFVFEQNLLPRQSIHPYLKIKLINSKGQRLSTFDFTAVNDDEWTLQSKVSQCCVNSRSHQQVTQFSWFILTHMRTMFHDSYFTQHLHQLPHLLKVQIKCKKQTVVFGQTEFFCNGWW